MDAGAFTIIAALIGALLGWLIHEIACAPLGYEDSTGFHYGEPPETHLRWGR